MISGLADGEQRVAHCPIRTKPKPMERCVPRAPQGAVSTMDGAVVSKSLTPPSGPH